MRMNRKKAQQENNFPQQEKIFPQQEKYFSQQEKIFSQQEIGESTSTLIKHTMKSAENGIF